MASNGESEAAESITESSRVLSLDGAACYRSNVHVLGEACG